MNNRFTFSHTVDGTRIESSFSAETWHEALSKFVSFMGAVQGYSIADHVAASIGPHALDRETWSGPVFDPEESL